MRCRFGEKPTSDRARRSKSVPLRVDQFFELPFGERLAEYEELADYDDFGDESDAEIRRLA